MRKITNREAVPCSFCGVTIQTGEECVQSQAKMRYGYKWHVTCTPEVRLRRFGSSVMNTKEAKQTLYNENIRASEVEKE